MNYTFFSQQFDDTYIPNFYNYEELALLNYELEKLGLFKVEYETLFLTNTYSKVITVKKQLRKSLSSWSFYFSG